MLLAPVRQARYRSTHMSLSKSPAVTLTHCTGASRPGRDRLVDKAAGLFISSVGRAGMIAGPQAGGRKSGDRRGRAHLHVGLAEYARGWS